MDINSIHVGDTVFYHGHSRPLETFIVEEVSLRGGGPCINIREVDDGGNYNIYEEHYNTLREKGKFISLKEIQTHYSGEDLFERKLSGTLPQLVSEHMKQIAIAYKQQRYPS